MRKKSGVPLVESFTSPLYLHGLQGLCSHLNLTSPPSAPRLTEKDLALVVFKTIAVLDKYCGKGAPHQQALTKFPMRVFEDLAVNGSLHCVLETVLQQPPSFLDSMLQGVPEGVVEEGLVVFGQVDSNLRDRGFLHHPKVFFGSTVPREIIPELRNIVSKHKGEIVKAESVATHIIEW